jgi:Cys-tRNA(Pro)/Cys-tRNA(Cys) deacylase
MTTRAIQFLKRKNIPFEVIRYDHMKKGAVFASRSIKFPLEKIVKTLVADIGASRYILVLTPGHRRVSPKRLAEAHGVKRAALSDSATAVRTTGYKLGGISPFGIRHSLPVIMEKTLLDHNKVAINGGQRGIMLVMTPADIIRVVDGRTGSILE